MIAFLWQSTKSCSSASTERPTIGNLSLAEVTWPAIFNVLVWMNEWWSYLDWNPNLSGGEMGLSLLGVLFLYNGLSFWVSRVLNSTMFESWAIIGPYPSWWVFNVLLLLLQVMHVFWAYLIFRIAFKAIMRGKVRSVSKFDFFFLRFVKSKAKAVFCGFVMKIWVTWRLVASVDLT